MAAPFYNTVLSTAGRAFLSSVILFAQMMFADQVHGTRLRSFFTALFCEAHSDPTLNRSNALSITLFRWK